MDVSQEISSRDRMYSNKDQYFSAGQSALECVKLAMFAAGKRDFERILDLPCGHGRVLRFLKAAFPGAEITACDIDEDAVDFCTEMFGTTPVYSREHPDQIQIDGHFDLIWCGSLLTHLSSDKWRGFLDLFYSICSPGGIIVFTTHGRYVAERLRGGHYSYGLAQDSIDEILRGYDSSGFGYGHYPSQSNYGISVSSPSWGCRRLERLPDLHLLGYAETLWDRHQDVIACMAKVGLGVERLSLR